MLSFFLFGLLFVISIQVGAEAPQKCVALTNIINHTVDKHTFMGSAIFSINHSNDGTEMVVISNISAAVSDVEEIPQICVKLTDLTQICITDLSESISIPLQNSTFDINAFFNNGSGTNFQFNLGYGVYDEGGFNFPSGEMFYEKYPCVALYNHTNGIIDKNYTQCCTAFEPITQISKINVSPCNKFKARTTIYNVDDNFSIFATAEMNYTLYETFLLAHTSWTGKVDWDFNLSINNYTNCFISKINETSYNPDTCWFSYSPNTNMKFLLELQPFSIPNKTSLPIMSVGRLIIRNNQTLMEEGMPYTKTNDCFYTSQQFSSNQVSSSSFCCTNFSET